MPGNGKVFISHTHEDNERCVALLAALDAWGVDYWFDTEQLAPGSQLSDRIQQGLAERAIFIRVCTPAAQSSFWMDRELAAARGMRADVQSRGQRDHRTIIFLILAPGYVLEPDAQADVVIDATTASRAETLKRLRTALGVAPAQRRVSRRRILAASVAGAAIVAGGAAGGSLYLTKDVTAAPPVILPKGRLATPTAQPAASRLKWFFKTAGGDILESNVEGLAAGGGVVYVAADDGIYALGASDGAIRWFQSTVSPRGSCAPVVAGDTLYVGILDSNVNNQLAALSIADGSIRWMAPLANDVNSTPAVSPDLICIRDAKALYALGADGSKLWQLPIPEGDAALEAAPAIANGVVYVAGGDQTFYALNGQSGAVIWSKPVKGVGASSPAVANGGVFFGTNYTDGGIYALSTADGSQLWRVDVGGGSSVDSSPVVADGTVYIGSGQGVVFALDAATGKARWQVAPAGNTVMSIATNAVVANGVVYVTGVVSGSGSITSTTVLWALSAQDGSTKWQYSGIAVSSLVTVSPAADSGTVFFSSGGDHTVYALSV
jgi:eukaryotic-like serine/threonine-protein kinase